MPGKRVTCYTCGGFGKIYRLKDGREISCNTCGGSGAVSSR